MSVIRSGNELLYTRSSARGVYSPIQATGGTVTDLQINGVRFRQHEFTGNANYDFTVFSLGDSDGSIEYEITLDGYSPGTFNTSYLNGTTVRKISPFESGIIFKYTSAQSASSLSYAADGGDTVGIDSSNKSKAEVQGACRTGINFTDGLDLHFGGGGRMPTLEEYLNNTLQGSGCGHDNIMNWTTQKGTDETTHYICRGRNSFDSYDGGVRAVANSTTSSPTVSLGLRDIADVDLNRVDPNIIQDTVIYGRLLSAGRTPEVIDGPKVDIGVYNLLLGSGQSTAIPNTGPQESGTLSGIGNNGNVYVRYPLVEIV